jgi:murein DD-endopeptidase MepM/ murein hydrolase activator NlpD
MRLSLIYFGFFVFVFSQALFSQQNSINQLEQDFNNFRNEYQSGLQQFKLDRDRELRQMQEQYQHYINELYSLRTNYIEINDTLALNIVDELIEFEEQIGIKTGNVVKPSEVVKVPQAEKPQVIDPLRSNNSPRQEINHGNEKQNPDSNLSQTTFVPLSNEGSDAPSLTPLISSRARVTSPFGMRFHPTLNRQRMHNGIDFGSGMNAQVFAAADGIVILAQFSRSFGNWIIVEHKNGYSTIYAHLNRFNVRVGQNIKRGDILGYSGSTGRSTGPHLHYEVRIKGTPVNPAGYLIGFKD